MAGLLDNLFYSNPMYGGQGGGLLDFLRTTQMQNDNYQPSAGFAPINQQPSPPPLQSPAASPMSIGGYQMPRIGDAAQFDPSQVNIPPNAQPTQGQSNPMMQAPQPAASPSFLSGIGSFARPDSIVGRLFGGGSAENQTAKALLAKGVDPQTVQAAVANPELMKLLITQNYGPHNVQSLGNGYVYDPQSGKTTRAYEPEDQKQVVKVGQDSLGREQYGIFNKTDGSITPYTPPNATGGGQDPMGNTNLTGKAYLDTLPKEQANTVQMMVEGKIQPPTSFAMSKPYWQNMIAAAHNYDPTFDATAWSGRVAGVKDFSAGKSSEMVRAANQTLAHVGSLLDSMDNLHNGRFPAVNAVGNFINEQTGGGQPGAFRTNAHAVAEEMSKVFKGANLSDAEIRQWEQNLTANMSPEQQRAQIAKLSELLHGSLSALEEKRVASIGPVAAAKAGPIIKDEGVRVLDRIDNWLKQNGSSQTPAPTAPAPSAGSLPAGWTVKVR